MFFIFKLYIYFPMRTCVVPTELLEYSRIIFKKRRMIYFLFSFLYFRALKHQRSLKPVNYWHSVVHLREWALSFLFTHSWCQIFSVLLIGYSCCFVAFFWLAKLRWQFYVIHEKAYSQVTCFSLLSLQSCHWFHSSGVNERCCCCAPLFASRSVLL